MAKKIIVGIDIRDLKVAATGQKTFLEELYNQFRKIENEDFSFVFFNTILPVYKGRNKFFLIIEHLRYQCWKQLILPLKAAIKNCDIVFCTDYFVPFVHLGFKSVQVFHDAFFYENPEHYNKYWMYLYKYVAIPAAKKSTYIITPTDYARNSIHHFTKIPLSKLITIYEAPKTLNLSSTPGYSTEKIKEFVHTKYIFHVSVIEKRKNIPALIKAFKLLIDSGQKDLKLVLAGQGTGRKESDDTENIKCLINLLQLDDQIILTGYLTNEELSLAYNNAFMYVFPSFNEGFGLPLLEAFQANIPVLVANNSCLPEVGGNAVLTFNPFDVTDIFQKMKQVIDNAELKNQLIKNGQQRLQQFSWANTAGELMEVFKIAAVKN